MSALRAIEPEFRERIWGTTHLEPWFPNQQTKIGEAWFMASPDHPLLVKFIFTADRLSLQVHPGDEYARIHENSRGKSEMWHILDAEPDAVLGLGFTREVTHEEIREAVDAGTLDDLIRWVPVQPGDTFNIQAGIVHAIGAGITLCEIQQNSDITYRLYDYNRGRELHLGKALDVLDPRPRDVRSPLPVDCPFFRVDELRLGAGKHTIGPGMLIGVDGEHAGEVWDCSGGGEFEVTGSGRYLLASAR